MLEEDLAQRMQARRSSELDFVVRRGGGAMLEVPGPKQGSLLEQAALLLSPIEIVAAQHPLAHRLDRLLHVDDRHLPDHVDRALGDVCGEPLFLLLRDVPALLLERLLVLHHLHRGRDAGPVRPGVVAAPAHAVGDAGEPEQLLVVQVDVGGLGVGVPHDEEHGLAEARVFELVRLLPEGVDELLPPALHPGLEELDHLRGELRDARVPHLVLLRGRELLVLHRRLHRLDELERPDVAREAVASEERGEEHRGVHGLHAAAAGGLLPECVEAEVVVGRAELVVGEDLVGFSKRLELLLGVCIVRILIRMNFLGQLIVRLFYLPLRRGWRNLEQIVQRRVLHIAIVGLRLALPIGLPRGREAVLIDALLIELLHQR
mmetsp:Transcript_26293/g.65770  ORF Transcript_26293/g.65770 Transcript_26293/m.65770 type:complete len:375 (-) Transcript_26293:16-1140(-)